MIKYDIEFKGFLLIKEYELRIMIRILNIFLIVGVIILLLHIRVHCTYDLTINYNKDDKILGENLLDH